MARQYYSILTNRGKALEAASAAGGTPVNLKNFVVGDGNGQPVAPEATQTGLVNEVYRGAISLLEVSPEQENQFIAYIVLPEGVGDFTVREVGLLTDKDELYALGNSAAIEKPVNGVTVTLQFRLAVSESAQITLQTATGDGLFLRQDANLSDVRNKTQAIENLGLKPTVDKAAGAVQRAGDTMSGSLTFENDSELGWVRNTDWAKIGFKNTSDTDADSFMWFETGDNGNEYFKWRSRQGTATKELMNLKWDVLSVLVNAVFSGNAGIGTTNGLGGNSIALGDTDTGLKQNGDGILDVYANSQQVFRFSTGSTLSNKPLTVSGNSVATGEMQAGNGSARLATDGNVYGSAWGGWLSNYIQNRTGVQDVRLGAKVWFKVGGDTTEYGSGYVLTGGGDFGASDGTYFARPLQKLVNGTWYNAESI
ncbi:phage tail protein [Enterobacter ludwigii]|uniref:phage tail protein n=1 Tax=Enterobacter ludwigii TaxID=299767 RepID=UPI002A83DAA0|nr:phage tail protein [Enterobacter ludwigii]